MAGAIRALFKFAGFIVVFLAASADFLVRVWARGRSGSMTHRVEWCHRWGRAYARLLGVRARVHGTFPKRGLLASNHLSYLDIVVQASCSRLVFVSKHEVKNWPVVGILTRCAGTLFIRREQRGDVKRLAEAFAPIIDSGFVVTLYPEGTSTGGDRVLPFHSSLFEPAAANGWPVTPVWIGYEVPGGDPSEDVAYWKDMTFLPHLLRLFTLREIHAVIRVGSPLPPGLNRKQLAKQLHEQVCAMAEAEGRRLVQAGPEPVRAGQTTA